MFLLQLLLAFQDVVFVADNPEFIDEGFRHSTEWLAGVDATTKEVDEDGSMWFTPGCDPRGFWEDEELPKCSAWYNLLIGELRLRENPDFTVRMLELCLFTLSGSIFLLIIR